MIDADKVKAFWESRAKKLGDVAFESIVNLEEDEDALSEKIQVETKNVFDFLGDIQGKTIIDLGAGIGQWAFRFQEQGAAMVTAVEYASNLVRIGSEEAARRGITNVEFRTSPAETFNSERSYDIVYISGLFVYLNDDQVTILMPRLKKMLAVDGGILLLRDGTGDPVRHEINQEMSTHLGTEYSAIYRTRDEYLTLFSRIGLTCVRDKNMFPEGHPLNKYRETRLRLYRFEEN
ncbi:MAG: class I SAM-dependent methyltransferase [Pseudomonadota bacterium]